MDDPKSRERSPQLDRRTFLSRSALASGSLIVASTALAATNAGCGATLPGSTMAGGQTQELMERLERGLGRVRGIPRGHIAQQMTWVARPHMSESVLRQTLEALVIADVARSLPEGVNVPQPLAGRLIEELPVLGVSTETHHALLARMPAGARRQLDARIEREPDIPMEIAGWLDRHADELGTSRGSRLKLRLAARDVQARLRRQSANAVIDDCVAKVGRVVARSGGSLALARSTSATAMIDTIWQQVDGLPPGGGLSTPRALPRAATPDQEAQDLEWARFMDNHARYWSARWRRPGDEEIQIGASMMPFGLVTCGLLLIIGLIVLIAGAVQNADWLGGPRDPH